MEKKRRDSIIDKVTKLDDAQLDSLIKNMSNEIAAQQSVLHLLKRLAKRRKRSQ